MKKAEMSHASTADHLFVSYASEDWALAEWLTLRLTEEGYRVWCSSFRVIGGEPYPRNIGHAIRHDTFRLLALLSRASLSDPIAIKERSLALELAGGRNIEFLIGLAVNDLKLMEHNWATRDLAFIPFHERWETGFNQLLMKLILIEAPRPLTNGKQIALEVRQFMALRRSWPTVL